MEKKKYRIIIRNGPVHIEFYVLWSESQYEQSLNWFYSGDVKMHIVDIDKHVHIFRSQFLNTSAVEIIEVG